MVSRREEVRRIGGGESFVVIVGGEQRQPPPEIPPLALQPPPKVSIRETEHTLHGLDGDRTGEPTGKTPDLDLQYVFDVETIEARWYDGRREQVRRRPLFPPGLFLRE